MSDMLCKSCTEKRPTEAVAVYRMPLIMGGYRKWPVCREHDQFAMIAWGPKARSELADCKEPKP